MAKKTIKGAEIPVVAGYCKHTLQVSLKKFAGINGPKDLAGKKYGT